MMDEPNRDGLNMAKTKKENTGPAYEKLNSALANSAEFQKALARKLDCEARLSQLNIRSEHWQEQIEAVKARLAEAEARRQKALEAGKDLEAVEQELITIGAELESVRQWIQRLDDTDLPQARADLKESTKAVAVAAAGIMADQKAELESDLLAALSGVLQKAQDWKEAKKAAWQGLGINPDTILGLPRVTLFLAELGPELRDAFGTARPGLGF